MKNQLLAWCLFAATTSAFASDVSVSVVVGQPGFYGRIDLGNQPPPVVIYSRPVLITPMPVTVVQQPLYLRVPPGHAKKWAKHCASYNACGQPVYFVQESWYQKTYASSRDNRNGQGRDDDHDQGDRGKGGKHKDKDKGKHKD